jgi:hypothetical protein
MTDITIPAAALEAFKRLLREQNDVWLTDDEARAACRAMLNAWPGMWQKGSAGTFSGAVPYAAIILPLPQESPDD